MKVVNHVVVEVSVGFSSRSEQPTAAIRARPTRFQVDRGVDRGVDQVDPEVDQVGSALVPGSASVPG